MTFPFMPGSCEEFAGNRRYLCWNDAGAILLRQDTGEPSGYAIDIQYADGRERSLPSLAYQFASMDRHGHVLASLTEVVYTHAATWAPDGSTTLSFAARHERVTLVACGEEWFAVATDAPCIRVFLSAGMELAVLMMPVSVVVMTGRDNLLFYALGKDLSFSVVDVQTRREIARGAMTVAQPLKWVGVGTDMSVVCLDYANIVHKLGRDFGFQWVPVFQIDDMDDTEMTGFWVVYADDAELCGVPLRGTKSPATHPIPPCKRLPLAPQTIHADSRPWLTLQMDSTLIRRNPAKQKDRELLKLLPKALKDQQELRAVEIANLLKTKQCRDFVVPFADRQMAPRVGDKLTGTARRPSARPRSVQWRAIPGTSRPRSTNLIRTTSEERVYVRKAADATDHAEDGPAKPGGLLGVLQTLGRSKPAFQAEEMVEKERRKKQEMAPISTKAGKRGKLKEKFRPLFETVAQK
jgi:hypothetical protein